MPRRLGQHFLIRDSILERLAEAACGGHTARTIEIGAGKGALTRHLLPKTEELHAIELDSVLAAHLREKFSAETKFNLHEADVLATDLAQWGPAAIAGNLPYYITSPIVEKFLQLPAGFERAVFLVQWEVAERLLAEPGNREYGYLTVRTQLVCEAELVCRIPPSAFAPPPKVDSGAVLLRRREGVAAPVAGLIEFAGRCFQHKRKTLRNNLRPYYGERIDRFREAAMRAEQLSPSEFAELFEKLERSVH